MAGLYSPHGQCQSDEIPPHGEGQSQIVALDELLLEVDFTVREIKKILAEHKQNEDGYQINYAQ